MRSRFPALVAVAILVALSLPAIAGARSAPSAADAAQAEHDRIVAYWTPERVAAARPRDMIRTVVGFTQAPRPAAKPGGGGGGGDVKGASWTGNGIIEQRSGRILFTMDGGQWICSGAVVDDGATNNGYSVVLTAGHCVNEGSSWASNLMFIPNFDDGPSYTCNSSGQVYGCWTATRVAAHRQFVDGGGFGNGTVEVDYGFAYFGTGGKANGQLDAAVGGGYALNTDPPGLTTQQWAFGYPAAGRYRGKDLIYCTNATASLINDPNGSDTWGMACNMTGGSSGGPWVLGPSNPASDGSKLLSSVNSYGYTGLTYMFGPKLDSVTGQVMSALVNNSSTALAIVH